MERIALASKNIGERCITLIAETDGRVVVNVANQQDSSDIPLKDAIGVQTRVPRSLKQEIGRKKDELVSDALKIFIRICWGRCRWNIPQFCRK